MKVICFNSAAFKTYYTFMLINDYVYFLIFFFVCFYVNCYIFCYSYVMFSPNILTWKNCQFTYFQIFDQRGVYSRGSYLVRSYSKLSINFTHTLHKQSDDYITCSKKTPKWFKREMFESHHTFRTEMFKSLSCNLNENKCIKRKMIHCGPDRALAAPID